MGFTRGSGARCYVRGMPRLKMTPVDASSAEPIHAHLLPVFRGSGGGFDHECAGCESTLLENVGAGQFAGVAILCPACGTVCAAVYSGM